MELDLTTIQKIFMSNYDSRAKYHDWFHVSTVSSRALEIAVNEGDFTERELLLLSLACYMHDIGYDINAISDVDNVERSVGIFKKNANKLLRDISNEEVEFYRKSSILPLSETTNLTPYQITKTKKLVKKFLEETPLTP